jgi:structural maintenance of chromosome 1
MGRLVGLELYNFKSYRGITHVGFGTSYFTSIIGPNGSGKSNMMDAISFVLGIRSNQLRSKNIKSLIYRGRIDDTTEKNVKDIELDDNDDDNDDEGENDIVDLNEDSMDIDNPNDDSDSAYVIAIYEMENKEILNLKRKINPNGSTTFYVNDVQVSVSQYLTILKKENILIKAKNFLVFQGDVEKVASQSPIDLTKMIENISGSINLKKEFDSLKDEKDKAHDMTVLKNSQRRNLKDEIKNLKIKCFEIEQFDKKTKQLENIIIQKYLSKLEYFERLNDKLVDDLEFKNNELNKLSDLIDLKYVEYKNFVNNQSDEHMTIKEYESKIEIDESTLKSLKTNLIPLESETLQVDRKVKDYDLRIKQLIEEKSDQDQVVKDSEDVLSKIKSAFEIFKSEKDEKDEINNESHGVSSYSSNINMLTEYNQLREEFLKLAGNVEINLNQLNENKLNLNNEINSLKLSQNIIDSRIQDLETKKSSLDSKKSQIENNLISNSSSISHYKKELNSLESLRESIKEKEQILNSELKSVLLRLSEITSVQRENKREKKLRETCATLKRLFPNVRGLLNDICKPKQKKYGIALAAILGRNFDAIIVDTLKTATDCIEYMKEQRLGVASFIPLDTVKIQPLDSNLRNLSENAVPIIDVITYPSEFERAVQYVCGNSLVCDTIDIATSLRWGRNINVKLVTLDGALIHKSGLMTGGGTDNFNTKWDKSELGLLTERKEELKLKINEIHSNIPDNVKDRVIADEIQKIESKIKEQDKKLIDLNREIRDISVELEHEQKSKNEIANKIAEIELQIANLDEKIDSASIELKKSQNKIYKEFCSNYSFNSIEDYEINHSARLIKEARESSKYLKEIQRLENKLSFETERLDDYIVNIERLKADRQVFYDTWIKVSKERETMEDKIDDLQSEIDVTKEDYNKLKKKAKSLLSKATSMETEINSSEYDLKQLKKEIVNIEENIDSLKMERRTDLINAKIENVKLPLISGSLDDIPLEDGSKKQEELSQEWNEILSELVIDYSILNDQYKIFIEGEDIDESIESNSIELVQERCKSQIEKLQQDIQNIHPDMHAREHLETAQERYKEIESEFLNFRKEEKKIVSNFDKVKDERFEKFMLAFEHISNTIDDVYKELTKSKASPLGGSAYLTLEDEDEPYSYGIKYHIMPPLKRFRDMENLSGGEKTIGALALLFAVHSFHPSPFFVLDEVDAALDNSNVNKIANYIAKNKGPNFQFIVISLKNNLFERSDSLVGIYRDQEVNSSKILTLDLREYAED